MKLTIPKKNLTALTISLIVLAITYPIYAASSTAPPVELDAKSLERAKRTLQGTSIIFQGGKFTTPD